VTQTGLLAGPEARARIRAPFFADWSAVTDLQVVLGHTSLTTRQVYAQIVDAPTKASVEAQDF